MSWGATECSWLKISLHLYLSLSPVFLWLMLPHIHRFLFFPDLPMDAEMGSSSADIWESELQGGAGWSVLGTLLWPCSWRPELFFLEGTREEVEAVCEWPFGLAKTSTVKPLLYTCYINAALLFYARITIRLSTEDESCCGTKTSGIADAVKHWSLSKDHVLTLTVAVLL